MLVAQTESKHLGSSRTLGNLAQGKKFSVGPVEIYTQFSVFCEGFT